MFVNTARSKLATLNWTLNLIIVTVHNSLDESNLDEHSDALNSGPNQLKLIHLNTQSMISRTSVASVGSVFNDTRKVRVLSLPETIKEKSTFRAKALRRELVVTTN